MADKLSTYAISHLIDEQHGFLKSRSTLTNLITFEQYILNGFQENKQIDAVYTDFSKAFDKVNHERLL